MRKVIRAAIVVLALLVGGGIVGTGDVRAEDRAASSHVADSASLLDSDRGSVPNGEEVFAEGLEGSRGVLVRREVAVDRDTVRLSDLFTGLAPGQDREISRAPAPGGRFVLDAPTLQKIAVRHRLVWAPANLDERCVLTRATTHVGVDAVREALRSRFAEQGVKGRMEFTFDRGEVAWDLPGHQDAAVRVAQANYDPATKRFRADLEVGTKPVLAGRTLTGRLDLQQEVPVLTRALDAGAVLSASDVDMMFLPEERMTPGTILSLEGAVGRELRRSLVAGRPLTSRDLIPPRLVTRGTLVTLRIATPTLQITSKGRALQDGGEGETVRVVNTQSQRVVEGLVESPGVVRVPLGAPTTTRVAALKERL